MERKTDPVKTMKKLMLVALMAVLLVAMTSPAMASTRERACDFAGKYRQATASPYYAKYCPQPVPAPEVKE